MWIFWEHALRTSRFVCFGLGFIHVSSATSRESLQANQAEIALHLCRQLFLGISPGKERSDNSEMAVSA